MIQSLEMKTFTSKILVLLLLLTSFISQAQNQFMDFDGVDDNAYSYESVSPLPQGNSNFTVEVWIRPTTYNNYPTVLTWGTYDGGYSAGINLQSTGEISWLGGAGPGGVPNNNFYFPGVSADLNTWTHVAITYDGSYLTFYKNGVLVATSQQSLNLGSGNLLVGQIFNN